MTKIILLFYAIFSMAALQLRAAEIASVPSAMNQGGMIMPIVSIAGADNNDAPTYGTLQVLFAPTNTPVLAGLQTWSPGNWFASAAPWRADIGSPEGVGGTPAPNAGAGDIFSSRYGFTFAKVVLGVTNASVPAGHSLGLRLLSLSSPAMEVHNYWNSGGVTLWDQVFPAAGSQVLWDGMMWHSYFTLPALADPGTYTAQFEVFIAAQPFDTNAGTGRVDYTVAAMAAPQNTNFTSATINYTWTVVPEPSTTAFVIAGFAVITGIFILRSRRMRRAPAGLCAIALAAASAQAGIITSAPGPDDQGGMIMPMVFITDTDNPNNPTQGTMGVSFNPETTPVLAGLQTWSPGSWFDAGAAWRGNIGSPAGDGGTPVENAGNGDLFNCQYGFTFMADPGMGAAYVPLGKSLAIRLVSVSSLALRSFNYDDYDNIWDPIFDAGRPQVLWSGGMWHNYYTLPANATPGTYTATYEIFIADAVFSGGTGFADYSENALAALPDPNFTPAYLTYTWVVPARPTASIRFVNGIPTISIQSSVGRTYRLRTCGGDLNGTWTDLGAPKSGTDGLLEFQDTTSPLPGRKFYQVVEIQ